MAEPVLMVNAPKLHRRLFALLARNGNVEEAIVVGPDGNDQYLVRKIKEEKAHG